MSDRIFIPDPRPILAWGLGILAALLLFALILIIGIGFCAVMIFMLLRIAVLFAAGWVAGAWHEITRPR